eukprot:gene38650-52220_t
MMNYPFTPSFIIGDRRIGDGKGVRKIVAPRRRASSADMTDPALSIHGLAKAFDKPVIAGLDLEIAAEQRIELPGGDLEVEPAGQLYALLGPNGAGKTTTLRMVTGLTAPDAGTIRIFGIDARADPIAAKAITAWLPDEPMLYDKLTPSEYLAFIAGLWRMDPARASEEDALRAQVDAGKTVIITTHILEVAERMADRIGIIAGGKLLIE